MRGGLACPKWVRPKPLEPDMHHTPLTLMRHYPVWGGKQRNARGQQVPPHTNGVEPPRSKGAYKTTCETKAEPDITSWNHVSKESAAQQ